MSQNYNFSYKENHRLSISKNKFKQHHRISCFSLFRSDKNKQEPSETGIETKDYFIHIYRFHVLDIALTHSQKSVRELKLTLGRLVNFIQSSRKILFLILEKINLFFQF
jgi:hypothetical protein